MRTVLLVAMATVALAATPVRAQIPEAEYAARRAALAGRTGPGAVVAFGGRSPVGHNGEFYQLPAFRYLTGFTEPDAALVLVAREGGAAAPTLFTDAPPVRRQLYDGFREGPEAVAARTGLRVRPLAEMAAHVDSLAAAGVALWELRDFESADYASRDSLTRGGAFVAALRARHGVDVRDAHPHVDALRARKSAAEADLLRRAIDVTAEAHREVLAVLRPGAAEYEAEAAIEHAFRSRGAERPSFSSIVGSGPNATTLHYVRNDRRMEAGDVVVMDIGAEVAGYAADVTRTAPVSGRWTPEQRAVYGLVLEAQKAAEALVRPGVPAQTTLDTTVAVRMRGLARLGLVESEDALYDPPWPADCAARPASCRQGTLWTIHGVSHGIGLEVHDPAQFYTGERVFGEGDAFTIEPGIYVSLRALSLLPDTPRNRQFIAAVGEAVRRYDNVGVRIEDDYLVTADGAERLSAGAPREADEIEEWMARPAGGER